VDDISRINPNTKTAPVFRSRADAELTAKIYAHVPVLVDEPKGKEGNPWNVSFMSMFHMSNDSALFRTAAQLRGDGYIRKGCEWMAPEGATPRQRGGPDNHSLRLQGGDSAPVTDRYLPLYEAKMMHQFDHRWATYDTDGNESRDTTASEKAEQSFEPEPQYWVQADEVKARLEAKAWKRHWLIGWRGISGVEKVRTVIATILPAFGQGNSILLMFPSGTLPGVLQACLCASLSSLALDYVARTKMGGANLNYYIVQQLPVLAPTQYRKRDLDFIVPRVLELVYTSHSVGPFARDLGYDGPPFKWDEDRRAQLRAELDAWYAHAYGLTRDGLRYILDPADVKGPDYPSETFRVLKKDEIAKYGEYRTARLVLQAWDRMQRSVLAAAE
jgi:hypothetical protein